VDFSAPLIQNAIRVFKEENDLLLTEEEAVFVLNSLADLYIAFTSVETTPERALARRGLGLLDSTSCTHKLIENLK
jgi:hypothetical protein